MGGLIWALGGMLAGGVVGLLVALLVARVADVTPRDGAAGYFVISIAILGALLGLGAGLLGFARAAPEGERWLRLAQGLLGLAALAMAIATGVWAWMQTREVPLLYDGDTQAQLLLEFRVPAAAVANLPAQEWLSVSVTTSTTRPEATVLHDKARSEDARLVVPAIQGPLIRASNRVVVARLELPTGPRDEVFVPSMPRTPDPRAPWSEWMAAGQVVDARGERRSEPPLLEMRWRLQLYGE